MVTPGVPCCLAPPRGHGEAGASSRQRRHPRCSRTSCLTTEPQLQGPLSLACFGPAPPCFSAWTSPAIQAVSPPGWPRSRFVVSWAAGDCYNGVVKTIPRRPGKKRAGGANFEETNMNTSALPAPLVLGLTLITANARRQLEPEDVSRSLQRHARRDWGRCRPQNPPAQAASLEGVAGCCPYTRTGKASTLGSSPRPTSAAPGSCCPKTADRRAAGVRSGGPSTNAL